MVSWRFQSSFLSSYKLHYIKVQKLRKPLIRQLTIYRVMCWVLFIINHISVILALIFVLSGLALFELVRDGLTGFFASFELSVSHKGLANVPDSEGTMMS